MALATRPKPSAHHRKRQGTHHRHSKPYLKTYWPYLPMVIIVGLGLMVNGALTSHQRVLGATSDFSQATLLDATNSARLKQGESQLQPDTQLTQAAVAKANDMATKNYWAHNSPDGKTPWAFITAAGYSYSVAGENLAYGFGDGQAVIKAWLNSPEHRANILNANYQQVGFGVASVANFMGKGPAVIVVAEYAQPSTAVANIHFTVAQQSVAGVSTTAEPSVKTISRFQTLTGQSALAAYAISAIIGAAATIFIIRHTRKIHRWVTRSEYFIAHHPWLDIAMVLVVTVGYVITRSSGVIR